MLPACRTGIGVTKGHMPLRGCSNRLYKSCTSKCDEALSDLPYLRILCILVPRPPVQAWVN